MRNRWGHFYAASVKVYYTLRYYGISIQEEYDIWETGLRTLLYGLSQDLLYASILWYINTRGIWYMRNRWGHFYAASVKVYYIRFDSVVYQYKRHMIYEKQVRTLLCGLRQDLLYASILWYINTRGIWYMRNRWGHSYAAFVKVYYIRFDTIV